MPVIRDLIAARHQRQRDAAVLPGALPRGGAGVHARGSSSARRAGLAPRPVASVASFFLSRIDTAVDQVLDALAARGQPAARTLRGKAAIASACRAFEIYEELTRDAPSGRGSRRRGARPQRLLWASTSAKDPSFSPIKYVEELVVPDTVNTMPLETLNTYRRLGRPGAAARAAHRRQAATRARDSSGSGSISRPWRSSSSARASPSSSSLSTNCNNGSKTSAEPLSNQRLRVPIVEGERTWTSRRYASDCSGGARNCAQRASEASADLRHEADPLSADFAEQVTQRENDDVLGAISDSARAELQQVEAALRRLDAGRYGSCAVCGEDIEPERLAAVPYTDRCRACAERAAARGARGAMTRG